MSCSRRNRMADNSRASVNSTPASCCPGRATAAPCLRRKAAAAAARAARPSSSPAPASTVSTCAASSQRARSWRRAFGPEACWLSSSQSSSATTQSASCALLSSSDSSVEWMHVRLRSRSSTPRCAFAEVRTSPADRRVRSAICRAADEPLWREFPGVAAALPGVLLVATRRPAPVVVLADDQPFSTPGKAPETVRRPLRHDDDRMLPVEGNTSLSTSCSCCSSRSDRVIIASPSGRHLPLGEAVPRGIAL
mmetsp:Transcript_31891/g.80577  ORF Transcript_31891/g.80577 Transcript_31891/m.80577 type:complete len:251 (-) Transcript_31891:176-928(-)